VFRIARYFNYTSLNTLINSGNQISEAYNFDWYSFEIVDVLALGK
jgi:hypothetical protein